MRRRKADLHARVNGDLALRFTGRGLTSFSGLELFRRFLHGLKFSVRLRHHLRRCDPSADFSSVTLIRLLLAMMVVGARRLGHVRHLVGDPVIQRFCGLAAWPSDRTVSRWLGRCTAPVRAALQAVLGHGTIAVTERYGTIGEDLVEREAQRLAQYRAQGQVG